MKKKDCMVSIVVPIFNAEQYLDRCLNSLINQTYKNIEIILVDDGSNDDSLSICKKFQKLDSRIILFSQKNSGVSVARNNAIKNAKGNYITFVDSDDYLDINCIDYLTKIIIENNVDLVISNAVDFNDNGIIVSNHNNMNNIKLDMHNTIIHYLNNDIFSSVCWGNLYKTSYVKKLNFDENMRIAEDSKFLLDYIKMINSCIVANKKLYYYYIRPGSTIHSGFSEKYYDELFFCKKLINDYNDDYELKQFAEKKYYVFLSRLLKFSNLNKKDYKRIIEEYDILNYKKNKIIDWAYYFLFHSYYIRRIILKLGGKND